MVFQIDHARVHLDRIEGFGEFLEREVNVGDKMEPEAAISEAHRLVAALSIDDGALVKGVYLDLLQA